jgi:hypothetical protein
LNIATGQCGAAASTVLHILQLAVILRRLHPRFRLDDVHVEHPDAPALLGSGDVAAERLRQHLVTETDPDEGFAGLSHVLDERIQGADPFEVVVDREARTRA